MKLKDLRKLEEIIEDQRQDPEFREEWDRLAFAREVANLVIRYRTERNLSQREFASFVGMHQPQVARIEGAEHQPSLDTLAKLSQRTGLKFRFEVAAGMVELF